MRIRQSGAKTIGGRRHQNQVDVVRHQVPGNAADVVGPAGLRHEAPIAA
jgi:hypothetical protein